MDATTIQKEQVLLANWRKLAPEQQDALAEYVAKLEHLKGTPGKVFVERTQHLHISDEDAQAMIQAIEEAFEQVEDFPEVNFDE